MNKLLVLGLIGATALVLACGSDGAPGAPGEPGKAGAPADVPGGGDPLDPSSGLIVPNKGVLDRALEVTIGGSGTAYTDATKVDFGAGVTVGKVRAISPTSLSVELTIAADAEVGARDVKIGEEVAKGAFSVLPALDLQVSGKAEQGGSFVVAFTNNDSKAFATGDSFEIDIPGLIPAGGGADGPQSGTAAFLVPPLAPTGKLQVTASNLGPDGAPALTFLSAPGAVEVVARAPKALVANTPVDEAAKQGGSSYFKLTSPAATTAIVEYRLQVAADGAVSPTGILFGPKGKADDIWAVAQPPSSFFGPSPPPYDLHVGVPTHMGAAADLFLVVMNNGGAGTLKVTPSVIPASAVAESGAAHGPGAPQTVGTLPASDGLLVPGEIKAAGELDVYKFSAAMGDDVFLTASSDGDFTFFVLPAADAAEEDAIGGVGVPAGTASSSSVAALENKDFFVLVKAEDGATKPTGKYTLAVRKLPKPAP